MGRENVLTEELLTAHIEKCDRRFREIVNLRKRGFMTENEYRQLLEETLFEGFFGFLGSKGFSIRVNHASEKGFFEDYRRWQSGEGPDSSEENPWLRGGGGLFFRKDANAASARDKAGFFRLMTAFHLPAAYFEPVPETIIVPECRQGHFAEERIIGAGPGPGICYWPSDGGLSEAADPVGKTFVLTDRLGLKTTFTVTDKAPDRYSSECLVYSGTGVIEGYFSARERKIYVIVRDGHILHMKTFVEGQEDTEAYESFPLWAQYHVWEKQKTALWEEALEKCVNGDGSF